MTGSRLKPLAYARGSVGGSERGVTLLEVLIAVSLVALLSVGILTAMRVGLDANRRANDRLMHARRVRGAQKALSQQIAGFMPVLATFSSGPAQPAMGVPFFQGEPQSMRFVSSYSLEESSRGLPRILEFQVVPGDGGRGVRLVVNEHLYTGPASAGMFCLGYSPEPALGMDVLRFRPVAIGPNSFVLADRLAFCRFSYLESLPPPQLERWVPFWVTRQWPRAVQVEMAPLEADPSRVQPVTVVAPVRITRDLGMNYVY